MKSFSARLVAWQKKFGRHHLSWQGNNPYYVWLSEIMLQQTQVSSVLSYFERFIQRFPTLQSLANAQLDEVLHLWQGLGYYQRARNLHACAKLVWEQHGGQFPGKAIELQKLPGIGRSTASAIAAFCFHERVSILDGNARRVIGRYFGVTEGLANQRAVDALWAQAQTLLPKTKSTMPAYTQGLMDLGSLICTRQSPRCEQCPVNQDCMAYQTPGALSRIQTALAKPKRSQEHWWLLWASLADGSVWLAARPLQGIWGGLYCFPIFKSEAELDQALAQLGTRAQAPTHFLKEHTLTHKDLYLHFVCIELAPAIKLNLEGRWFTRVQYKNVGMPKPIVECLK